MDRDEALARVGLLVSASQRPALDTAELDAILDAARTLDVDGRHWDATDWVPSWDLDRACAEAFRVKAAKVAGDFNFSADDASYSKGDVMARLLAMADTYAARGVGLLTAGDERSRAPYDAPRLLVN